MLSEVKMETAVKPEKGRCYKGKNGERVCVITVATLRVPNDMNRPSYVIIRHRDDRYLAPWEIREMPITTSDFAITFDDWNAGRFEPITRAEFLDETYRPTHHGWVLIQLTKEAHDSRDIGVIKVAGYDVMRKLGEENKNAPPTVTVTMGRNLVKRVPIDGKVHHFREDARRAKREYCKAQGLYIAGARDHYDWDYDGGRY